MLGDRAIGPILGWGVGWSYVSDANSSQNNQVPQSSSLLYGLRAPVILGLSPLLLFGLIGTYGTVRNEIRRFENEVARDIAGQLGGDEKVVSIRTKPEGPFGPLFADLARASISASNFSTEGLPLFTDPERSKSGTIRRLDLNLSNFTLKGLRIERLEAQIPDCRFDAGLAQRERQIRLSQSGTGRGWVEVLEKDLAPFILKKVKEIKRVEVKLDRGKAWIEGYGEFIIAKTDFLVVADLTIEEGTRINLENAKVIFGWRKADPAAQKVLLDALNPVVDLRKDLDLYDAFYLEKIELKGGKMRAEGKTRIPNRPNREPS